MSVCLACGLEVLPITACRCVLKEKNDDLLNILTRYEGAVGAVERDGDDSDEAVKELEEARAALLRVLRAAKEKQ